MQEVLKDIFKNSKGKRGKAKDVPAGGLKAQVNGATGGVANGANGAKGANGVYGVIGTNGTNGANINGLNGDTTQSSAKTPLNLNLGPPVPSTL